MRVQISTSDTKQVDISALAFAGEGDYITVKRIDRVIKNKIQLYSANAGTTKFSLFLNKRLKSGEVTTDSFENDEDFQKEIVSMMQDMSDEEIDRSSNATIEIERLTIDYGIDEDAHSITDMNDVKIKLTYDVIASIGDDFLKLVIKSINEYNAKAGSLGEMITETLDM